MGARSENFFVTRYKEVMSENQPGITCLVPNQAYVGPPQDHPEREIDVTLNFPPRCLTQVIWKGLFLINQATLKLLNNNSGTTESLDVVSVTIGMISQEVWTYLNIFCHEKVASQQTKTKESYLDIDSTFTRKKIRTTTQSTILRFQTQQDLQLLRDLLGFGATYGLLEKRPTLSDGEEGVLIKAGHSISVVRGLVDGEEVPKKFRRYSWNPRVVLVWNEYHVRVVVCFVQYRYNVNPDSTLSSPTPTDHMNAVLSGLAYNRTSYNSSDSASVSSSSLCEEGTQNSTSNTTTPLQQPAVFMHDQFCSKGTKYTGSLRSYHQQTRPFVR